MPPAPRRRLRDDGEPDRERHRRPARRVRAGAVAHAGRRPGPSPRRGRGAAPLRQPRPDDLADRVRGRGRQRHRHPPRHPGHRGHRRRQPRPRRSASPAASRSARPDPARHLSFSYGTTIASRAPHARLEGRVALEELTRTPGPRAGRDTRPAPARGAGSSASPSGPPRVRAVARRRTGGSRPAAGALTVNGHVLRGNGRAGQRPPSAGGAAVVNSRPLRRTAPVPACPGPGGQPGVVLTARTYAGWPARCTGRGAGTGAEQRWPSSPTPRHCGSCPGTRPRTSDSCSAPRARRPATRWCTWRTSPARCCSRSPPGYPGRRWRGRWPAGPSPRASPR